MLEKIVEDSISCWHNNISIFQIDNILICILRWVLAHIVLLFENFLELCHLLSLALFPKNFKISLSRELRELIRNVKSMLLFLWFKRAIGLPVFESDYQKPWISNICNLKLILIQNRDHSSSRANSIDFGKSLTKHICRIDNFIHTISIQLHIQSKLIIHVIIYLFLSHFLSRFLFQYFLF